jgi:exodeoxyribonuclease V gamma subunit
VRDRVLLSVSYSRLSARHRLAAWVRLLALSAAHPDVAYEAVTIGRAPRDAGGPVLLARIPGLGADADRRRATALRELDALADLRALGMREPLPLPCATAAAWAEAVLRRGADDEAAIKAARGEWESGWRFPKEDQADEHVLAFGGVLTLDELLAVGPRPGDPGIEGEGSRFARLAAALWQPLLSRETLEVV